MPERLVKWKQRKFSPFKFLPGTMCTLSRSGDAQRISRLSPGTYAARRCLHCTVDIIIWQTVFSFVVRNCYEGAAADNTADLCITRHDIRLTQGTVTLHAQGNGEGVRQKQLP